MKLRKWLVLLVPLALVASACSSSTSSGTASKLTIAAVQGVEDAGLKALAPMYKQQKGVDIQIVEAPYDDLYSKLVNAFKANDSTYDLIMMDDPWMPKFGTDGSLSDLGAAGHHSGSRRRPGRLGRRDVAAAARPGPADRKEQAKAAPRRDDRRQRRDVHVPQRPDPDGTGQL